MIFIIEHKLPHMPPVSEECAGAGELMPRVSAELIRLRGVYVEAAAPSQLIAAVKDEE